MALLEVKRVVVYGLVNAERDHRDYALMGEWRFDIYERGRFATSRSEFKVRRTKKGRFSKRGRGVSTRVQYRDPGTGRFVRAPTFHPKAVPEDDVIVADTLRIIEEETGHRMFRTPSQQESNLDRVTIGIQHRAASEVKDTYTYDEYLRELRHRVQNTWKFR